MKKVKFWVSVRPIGCYEDEFFIDENASSEEIEEKIRDMSEISIGWTEEGGYEKVMKEEWVRKNEDCH